MDREIVKKRVFMFEPEGYILTLIFVAFAWFLGGSFARTAGTAFFVIWLLARPIIQQLNLPPQENNFAWLQAARPELKELARKIWSFYDQYVTEEESWLLLIMFNTIQRK